MKQTKGIPYTVAVRGVVCASREKLDAEAEARQAEAQDKVQAKRSEQIRKDLEALTKGQPLGKLDEVQELV